MFVLKGIQSLNWKQILYLTHFQPMPRFCTNGKHQKPSSFLMFSEVMEVEYWLKMGYYLAKRFKRNTAFAKLRGNYFIPFQGSSSPKLHAIKRRL